MRNEVYRHLFDDITSFSKPFDLWERDTPDYGGALGAYKALIQTCKIINYEAKSIFEADYLATMTFYSDDVKDFYDLFGTEVRNCLTASSATFVLKTPILQGRFKYPGLTIMRQLIVGDAFKIGLTSTLTDELHPYLCETHGEVYHENATDSGRLVLHKYFRDGMVYRYLQHYPSSPSKFSRWTLFGRSSARDPMKMDQETETIEGHFCDFSFNGLEEHGDVDELEALIETWAEVLPRVSMALGLT